MLKAIHKLTGKIIPAFKLECDPTWIGKEREEWIAPYPEIDNWKFLNEKGITEVSVSFIKEHSKEINNQKFAVHSHFRINNEYAKPTPVNETEEHKLAKEGIYEDVIDNLLLINGKKIRDLFEIEDIEFEYPLSNSKCSKIADVIVKFKKKDEQYGRGIVFEIQLSNQNFEQTDDRTFDRIVEGYSVVWLWGGMFNEENKLINKELIVIPFLKVIEDYKNKKTFELYEELNHYGEIVDDKKKEILGIIEQKTFLANDIYHKTLNFSKEVQNKLKEDTKTIKEEILNDFNRKIQEKLKENHEIQNFIVSSIDYSILANKISNKDISQIKEELEKKLKKEIDERINQGIYEEIINSSIKKNLIKIGEEYSEKNFNKQIFLECNKCNQKFPIQTMIWEKGESYCSNCFNDIPNNWQKIWLASTHEFRKGLSIKSFEKKEKGDQNGRS